MKLEFSYGNSHYVVDITDRDFANEPCPKTLEPVERFDELDELVRAINKVIISK